MAREDIHDDGGERVAGTARRQTSKRAAWSLADQAFSSITNFALASVVARNVSQDEFGAFALIFSAYLLVLGVVRAFSTLPLLVRFTGVDDRDWTEGTRRATGSAIVGGAFGGAICFAAALVFRDAAGALVALAISLPGLMLQETWRLAFVAHGSPARALVNDMVWALALGPLLLWAVSLDQPSAEVFMLAWGVAGTVAGAVGIVQARIVPHPKGVVAWTRDHWDLSGHQLGEFAMLSGTNQGVMYAAGAVGGLAAAGALRAGQVLLGPLRTAYQAAWFVALSEFVRLLKRRPENFLRVSVWVSIVTGLGGLAYGAVFVVFGSTLGPILLGDTWVNARPLMVPLAISVATSGFSLGSNVGLRAMQEPARSLRARVTAGTLTLIGGIVGVLLAGAEGAAWGLATAGLMAVGIWWWHFQVALHAHAPVVPTEPTSDDLLADRTEDVPV
jgi:O-antigen/teichoic acid export membrane protein